MFRRFYNSSPRAPGSSLGPQWRHLFDRRLEVLASSTGAAGEYTFIRAIRPDGSSERFTRTSSGWTVDADVADVLVDREAGTGYALQLAANRQTEIYDATGLLKEVLLGSSVSARPLAERLAADIEMVEHSILASLVVHKSSESKSLCSQTPYACVGADGAELGLALIGGSRSAAAPRHLVELSRFRMDGALSEDYRCYLAAHGNSTVQAASKLDAKKLAGQCMS